MTRPRFYLGLILLTVAALAYADSPIVRIYQLDGSSQCQDDGVPLAEMRRTLEGMGIRVFKARKDFAPITDWRASSAYRMQVAKNLLRRLYIETTDSGAETRLVGDKALAHA